MKAVLASELPVGVIDAGPVAAARLVEQGLGPAVLERGSRVGAALLEWGHVRVFSPLNHNVDAAARALIEREGTAVPSGLGLSAGEEIIRQACAA